MDEQKLKERLTEKASEIIEEATGPIMTILLNIQKATSESGSVRLNMDDLYNIAIQIPVECSFLQANINERSIKQSLQDIVTDAIITDSITILKGTKGDSKERQRRAEAMNLEQMLTDETARQIIQALQATIVRADRVYEGIKKVIDARSREYNLDRKPGYPIGT